MNYTYAFIIIGWSRVYITDDEYAKNRFKYLAQRCPAVFLRFEHENLVENFLKETESSLKKWQIGSFKIAYPEGLALFLFDWVELSPNFLIFNDPRRCTFLRLRSFTIAR